MRPARALGDSVNAGQAVENPLPNETEPIANLAASQSFPALRWENKVKIFKIPGHVPGILTYGQVYAFGVRAARCKFSFDQSRL